MATGTIHFYLGTTRIAQLIQTRGLSFEKSDCSIRQADVQQSKQSGYTRVFNEVKSLGEIDSKTRTSDQTVIGNFWNGNIQDFWTLCGRFR